MTTEQFKGLASETIFAALAVIVSFNFLPETSVDTIGACILAGGLLIFRLYGKPTDAASIGSFVRKFIQSLAPVATLFGWLDPGQAAAAQALALSIVGPWSFIANRDPNMKAGTPPRA
jgi:hypothetical protein